ncbi:hypothetical protein [Helicobacter trogontum]|nr:hypothetical protein [Helicobacter trogontum]
MDLKHRAEKLLRNVMATYLPLGNSWQQDRPIPVNPLKSPEG